MSDDLAPETLARVLGDRPVRSYPALLSTHADALAWSRGGAPEGAVVVADYQASPRGRAGLEWHSEPGRGLGFSLILRPHLPPEREGWLYSATAMGLCDHAGEGATIEWPDEVRVEKRPAAHIGIHVELGPQHSEWAVVSVLLPSAIPPRGPLLADSLSAIEARYRASTDDVLADYLEHCETIGARVRARLIPMGPSGVEIAGEAVGAVMDGALVIATDEGRRVAVRPQNLGRLERA